ncbi:MAG: oxidoreductase C-terminal domain-containing protein, partial [Bradyrhizobium sp.]
DMAARMAAIHRDRGVKLILGSGIEAARFDAPRLVIRLTNGTEFRADMIIEGIGIAPCVALAAESGLVCDNGVCVDERYVTSDPAILAIGDVAAPPAGRQENWAHAQSSARAATRSIMSLDAEPAPTPWFWTTQFDHMLQIAGDPRRGDRTIMRGPSSLYLADNRIVGVAALDAPRDFAAARRLIGAAIDAAKAADPAVDLRKLASAGV